MSSMLIVMGGLPGSGKTALARGLARALDAVHLRIDTIEQALRGATMDCDAIGASGYRRRGQRSRMPWSRFLRFVDRFLPPLRLVHRHPLERLRSWGMASPRTTSSLAARSSPIASIR